MPSQRDTWVRNIRNRPEESHGRDAAYLQTVLAVDTWKVTPIDGTSVRGVWTLPIGKFNKEENMEHLAEEFLLGDNRWRMMLVDNRCLTPRATGQFLISIFVSLLGARNLAPNQPAEAHFSISLINQDPTKTKHQEATHSFSWETYVKGFANFVTAEDALNPAQGWIHTDPNGVACLVIGVLLTKKSRPHLDSLMCLATRGSSHSLNPGIASRPSALCPTEGRRVPLLPLQPP